jgi:hypothetical protein
MVSKKHGKITSYVDLYYEEKSKIKVQRAEYEDGSSAINIKTKLTPNNCKRGMELISLSYDGLRAVIEGLIGIYGKPEVERELGIKIGGKKDGN